MRAIASHDEAGVELEALAARIEDDTDVVLVPLTYEQFHYSFANAVGNDEAKELYLGYSFPGDRERVLQKAEAQ